MATELPATEPDLDALGLREAHQRVVVQFGDVDVGFAATNLTTTTAINDMSTAGLELKHQLVTGQAVDYFAPMHVSASHGSTEHVLFSGAVTEAQPSADVARVSAISSPKLREQQAGAFAAVNVPHPEIMYSLIRLAGLGDRQIKIQDFESYLRTEVIEVLTPVIGITGAERFRVAGVTFLPSEEATGLTEHFLEKVPDASELITTPACALTLVTADRLLRADEIGLRQIDAALAWLTVRARYGLAVLPDRTPQKFLRRVSIAQPKRGRFVIARGLVTQRCWLREAAGARSSGSITTDELDRSWVPPDGSGLTTADRQALLACTRAATDPDVLQRILALWEAIEFYVQGRTVPDTFSKEELKRIKKSLPSDLDPRKLERIKQVLGLANEPSLRMRLTEALRHDRVPITPGEIELLNTLRAERNKAVHGRAAQLPEPERVDHAVSVVARMILHRIWSGASGPAEPNTSACA